MMIIKQANVFYKKWYIFTYQLGTWKEGWQGDQPALHLEPSSVPWIRVARHYCWIEYFFPLEM